MSEPIFRIETRRNDKDIGVRIYAKYPNYVYPVITRDKTPSEIKREIEYAITKLKQELISHILTAKVNDEL